ncbi:hypothetical protein J4463_00690 [Candidatus Pacearchaeota archaeon]|nr:hypothetical protein [Candidatus Pacearchaeota archaeon]
MKAIIFDSGTLITMSMSCSLDLIRKLKKIFPGKFLITKEIEKEIVEIPMKIKKYKLGAMFLKDLITDKILEFPESMGIERSEIEHETKKINLIANNSFFVGNEPVKIIDLGEASAVALSFILNSRKIDNIIAIDERTTRVFCEKPENVKGILEMKTHKQVEFRQKSLSEFKQIKFMRSSELIYVGFKKGLLENNSKEFLDALLYSAKFKGCAVSSEELKEIEHL